MRIEDPWEFEHHQMRLGRHERSWVESYTAARPNYRIPTTMIVCPQCRGSGRSTMYLGFISQETFEEDPDFYYDYMEGQYDRTCESCEGRNVVEVINIEALDPAANEDYMEWMESAHETDAIERQERMMGA